MDSKTIRSKFIRFFTDRQHKYYPAVPIVNHGDPSLLFINAGMNPFKAIFLNHKPIEEPRICSAQPCLRVSGKHNDLNEVGVDTYHHTLFEMLGNWSFGDYYKEEAILWAWQLLTEVYGLPKDQLYVTVFAGDINDHVACDKESLKIWGHFLPKERILSCPKADNFWEMGSQGPCGPSSEIHIDLRCQKDRLDIPATALINQGHPEVIEIWNLVFMQYNRSDTGTLEALPKRHIDTGLGLERLAMVMQHKQSDYDTDVFMPLIEAIEHFTQKAYKHDPQTDVAMRVIADHIRALAFSIADGEQPSNSKRGYVIRRILRRAMRYGYSYLGAREPFINQLVPCLASQLEDVYPKIALEKVHIMETIRAEEHAFLSTLESGLYLFNQAIAQSQGVIDGQTAFKLYDTHGFPLDLIHLLAQEKGCLVDDEGFDQALRRQRLCSKKDANMVRSDWHVLYKEISSTFVGYDVDHLKTRITAWRTIEDRQQVRYQVVLEQTPFYPEGGGQCADIGWFVVGEETIEVLDVQKEYGLIVHTIGQLPMDTYAELEARIDVEHRLAVTANHTATHLLHAALRDILGHHVNQKGSLIQSDLLRFDFAYHTKLSKEELEAVESKVNEKIRAVIPRVEALDMPLQDAMAMGAQALFADKYSSKVRVITFDPTFSVECCGGTHVQSTGQIGCFKIIRESAVGTGIRRIEAVTAAGAERFIRQQEEVLTRMEALLKRPKDLVQALESLIQTNKQLDKQVQRYQNRLIQQWVDHLKGKMQGHGHGIHILVKEIEVDHVDILKKIALQLRMVYQHVVIILGSQFGDQAVGVVCMSKSLTTYLHQDALALVQTLHHHIHGRGGGQSDFALSVGHNIRGLRNALTELRDLLTSILPDNQEVEL